MSESLHVVLTGANRGLGLEFARRYAEAGHRVLATCRDPDRASALHDLAGRHAGRLEVAPLDVSEPRSCADLPRTVPWRRVDLLIHNAGVGSGGDDSLEAVEPERVLRTVDVNAVGPLRVTRALWDRLGEGSAIAHVSSLMGSIADNSSGGRYGYRISKAALNMAVRTLGHEAQPRGIVAFAIHPGWVRTDMGGSQAPLSIEESVGSMIETIGSRTLAHSGMFFDRDGAELPW